MLDPVPVPTPDPFPPPVPGPLPGPGSFPAPAPSPVPGAGVTGAAAGAVVGGASGCVTGGVGSGFCVSTSGFFTSGTGTTGGSTLGVDFAGGGGAIWKRAKRSGITGRPPLPPPPPPAAPAPPAPSVSAAVISRWKKAGRISSTTIRMCESSEMIAPRRRFSPSAVVGTPTSGRNLGRSPANRGVMSADSGRLLSCMRVI